MVSPCPLVAALGFSSLLIANQAVATDDARALRQEPIRPIPLELEVDTARAAIGEILFHDPRLSNNGQLSCASCHNLQQGGDDGLKLGISNSSGRHVVNTPTVYNAVFNFRQHWDGSMENLHRQVEHVIVNQHEFNNSWDRVLTALSADDRLVEMFGEAYADGMTRSTIIDSIVEFERTLITPNARFDRYLRGQDDVLTDEELEGYILFKETGCISCHQGINIGGNLFQKFGVFYNYLAQRGDIRTADFGRMNVTNRSVDQHVFKVPSLRNIEITAPYLHDGSAGTLEEVIIIMGRTQLGRELDDEEVRLIKAFLLSLTGDGPGNGTDTDS